MEAQLLADRSSLDKREASLNLREEALKKEEERLKRQEQELLEKEKSQEKKLNAKNTIGDNEVNNRCSILTNYIGQCVLYCHSIMNFGYFN